MAPTEISDAIAQRLFRNHGEKKNQAPVSVVLEFLLMTYLVKAPVLTENNI